VNKSLTQVETIAEVPFVLSHCNIAMPSRILVFGCFNDICSVMLASLGHEVIGFDLRSSPLTHPNLKIIEGDFLNTSKQFPNDYFDMAIAVHSLQLVGLNVYNGPVGQDLDYQVASKISSLLKPNSPFLLTLSYGTPGAYPKRRPIYRKYNRQTLTILLRDYSFTMQCFHKESQSGKWLPSDPESVENDSDDNIQSIVCVKALPTK
jgi:hypothetical protein